MNKKNMILASKVCLLVAMLGYCIPVFDDANGFAAFIYFFGAGQGALYIFIGIALVLSFLAMAASVVFSSLYYVRGKKDSYSKSAAAIDIALMFTILISTLFALITVKKFTEEDVDFGLGFYFMVYGLAAFVIVYLYSTFVMTFPSLFSVFLSLTNYSGGSLFEKGALQFVGLKNYLKVFRDQYFYVSLRNNFWIVLVSVFGQLPLGFFLAYVLTRGLVKGKDFFQTMIYLPCVISTVVIGILFQTFFSSHGAWAEIMKWFNPAYEWSMGNRPMLPVLFVILWMYTGTYLIIFMANLQKIDPQIMEAATIDGATEWQVLWHVIFPELSGVFVISAILAISGSLKSFDLVYVMTGGGPAKQTYVLSLYMFDKAFKGAADYPMANTISTIMVVISLILIGIVKTLEKKFGAKEE